MARSFLEWFKSTRWKPAEIGAAATWVLAIGTLIALWAQARSIARSRSAESYLSLVTRWDSQDMRRKRKRLARALCDGYPPSEITDRVEDVIDFFEDVGVFVRERYLSPRAAWGAFSSIALDYWWSCGREYVEVSRDEDQDKSIYEEYEGIIGAFLKRERKARRNTAQPPPEQIRDFLEGEARLDSELVSRRDGQRI